MGALNAPCSAPKNCRCPADTEEEISAPSQAKKDLVPGLPGLDASIAEHTPKLPNAVVSGEKGPSPKETAYWTKLPFDYDKTTEDSYGVAHFTGPNKSIRPLLDYTYHKKYTEDRVMFQDRIIEELCEHGNKQDDLLLPWVIFTAGAMGAGKGFVTKWLEQQGCLPLSQFVTVDPDQVRQSLPEWDGYVARDPLTAAIKTQKEAGHVAEILGYKALKSRWNVIFDGSLRDVEWYKVYFQKLRHEFPGIRLMILHIQAKREAVLRRAEERGKATGRMVPRQLLESSMDQVPKSVAQLAPYADVAFRVLNLDGQEPRLEREPTAINPPEGIPISCAYISKLWMPIDTDGDGQLSKEEVVAAVAQGILTEAVLDTVDVDGDGAISKEELLRAKTLCHKAADVMYNEPPPGTEAYSKFQKAKSRSKKWSGSF